MDQILFNFFTTDAMPLMSNKFTSIAFIHPKSSMTVGTTRIKGPRDICLFSITASRLSRVNNFDSISISCDFTSMSMAKGSRPMDHGDYIEWYTEKCPHRQRRLARWQHHVQYADRQPNYIIITNCHSCFCMRTQKQIMRTQERVNKIVRSSIHSPVAIYISC